jgi:hypothetical protein
MAFSFQKAFIFCRAQVQYLMFDTYLLAANFRTDRRCLPKNALIPCQARNDGQKTNQLLPGEADSLAG